MFGKADQNHSIMRLFAPIKPPFAQQNQILKSGILFMSLEMAMASELHAWLGKPSKTKKVEPGQSHHGAISLAPPTVPA
jgi:hypothetical protein